MIKKLAYSPTSRFPVCTVTVLGTLLCIGLAYAIDGYSFLEGNWRHERTGIDDFLIPLVIAPPVLFYLLSKLRELSLAHDELLKLAATDSLTDCFNRRAFTGLVEDRLDQSNKMRDGAKGALLVLDVDYFKRVNDRFGHDVGDEALRLIAAAIKANVRACDLVARLGGEEFGVFLPGLDLPHVMHIAERIRRAVRAVEFAPQGFMSALSISIGGAAHVPPASFSELYRMADQRLYAAKNAGRDRIDIATDPEVQFPVMALA